MITHFAKWMWVAKIFISMFKTIHYIINIPCLSYKVAENPFQPCFQKVPVKIPVNPSIRLLSHVLPELGNEARAIAGKHFSVLNTVVSTLHSS